MFEIANLFNPSIVKSPSSHNTLRNLPASHLVTPEDTVNGSTRHFSIPLSLPCRSFVLLSWLSPLLLGRLVPERYQIPLSLISFLLHRSMPQPLPLPLLFLLLAGCAKTMRKQLHRPQPAPYLYRKLHHISLCWVSKSILTSNSSTTHILLRTQAKALTSKTTRTVPHIHQFARTS